MARILLRNILLLTLAALLAVAFATVASIYQLINDNNKQELRRDAAFLLNLLQGEAEAGLLASSTAVQNHHTRITLIAADGSVLFDNRADADAMENHSQRPEVQGALTAGEAEAFRLSDTLGRQTYYLAVQLDSGSVLRFAKTTESVLTILYRLLTIIAAVTLAVIAAAGVLASRMVKDFMGPINAIDVEDPVLGGNYPELQPLLQKISQQNAAAREQQSVLRQQQEDFSLLMNHMGEGLVILDAQMQVVLLNPSALRILSGSGTLDHYRGQSILKLTRNAALLKSIQKGLSGHAHETTICSGTKIHQVLLNPAENAGVIRGLVILFLDVTEKNEVEALRREFSSNVSHELKTPLTAISIHAEMLSDGMVEPPDLPKFYQKIAAETQRMITLIDDILMISRLDEGAGQEMLAAIDLHRLAAAVADRLQPLAEERGVAITTLGTPVTVQGNQGILAEMIYNLAHNAVKYNRTEGGWVTISCREEEHAVIISVADNGIGIPAEHQSRVFERFYRVDKSHSRSTGGTGLGLSIVKHAAQYHNARIELSSAEGRGTTVEVIFAAGRRPQNAAANSCP